MDVENYWNSRKEELLNSIDKALERGEADKEVLELMKELLNNAKVKNSITDYFKEVDEF